jgi:O-antigen/teichoic acid export membrane protein
LTREGSGARVVRNTIVNGGAAFFGVAVFLVLTPFMILDLGAEAYGVFTLALTFSFLGGYAAFTDLGVEAATARFVAEARSDGDSDRVNALASSTMAFFGVAALVLAPLIAASALVLVDLFDVRPGLHDAAVLCFALVGAQLLFEMPARTYFAVLEGAQVFTAFQACELLRIVTQAGGFVAVLVFDLGIGALGGALVFSSFCVLLLAHRLAHRVVPELHVSPRRASKEVMRTLLGYGGGLVGLRLIGTVYRQMDRVIVGAAMGPRFVTVYEIANKIQSSAQMVQSIAASSLVPATAFARAQVEILRDMFLRGTAYTLAASLPVAGAVVIFAEPLIRTWIDPKYTDAAGPTRLFTAYLLLASVLIVGTTMTVALGHLRFLLLVNGPTVLANLVVSLLLVGPLGIEGVIIGSVASYLFAFPLQLRFFLRRFDVGGAEFVRRALVPQLPGLVAQAATAAPLLWLADRSDTIVAAGALAAVSIACSLAAFVAFGLRGEHRAGLLKTLREAAG